jgi:hypothetical protein
VTCSLFFKHGFLIFLQNVRHHKSRLIIIIIIIIIIIVFGVQFLEVLRLPSDKHWVVTVVAPHNLIIVIYIYTYFYYSFIFDFVRMTA